MAGRSDIKAGSAYVELTLKDSAFVKGLRAAGTKLKDFGAGMATIGAAVSAAGAAMTAPLLGALNHFAEFGSTLNDMSARTGISASALAELGHAAKMTGASMENVEGSVRKMQKFIVSAADGSKEARDSLRALGLTLADLKGLSPEDQFSAIAKKIGAIDNPTKRAAAAMAVFGKTGTSLLPMIADLETLRQDARDLNIVPDQSQVAAADALGDAFDRVKSSVGGVVFQVGAALAKSATQAANAISRIVSTASRWVKQNQNLVVTVAKVAVGLIAAGGIIVGLGLGIAAVGTALGGLATAIGAIGTVLGVILSPLGLVAAAIGAGVFVWARFTQSGRDAVGAMMGYLAPLLQTFRTTFGGIVDAIQGGQLGLAGQIAMQGLRVAFLQGVEPIRAVWADLLAGIKESFPGLSNAWVDVVAGIRTAWAEMIDGNESSWAGSVAWLAQSMTFLVDTWKGILNEFVGWWENTADWLTTGIGEEQQKALEFRKKIRAGTEEGARERLAQEHQEKMKALLQDSNPRVAADQKAKIEADRQAGHAGVANPRAGIDEGAAARRGAIDAANAELQRLTAEAAQAAKNKADADAAKKNDKLGDVPNFDMKTSGNDVFSTFSAAALAAQGGGQSATVDELRQTREEIKQQRAEAKQAAKEQAERDRQAREAWAMAFRMT